MVSGPEKAKLNISTDISVGDWIRDSLAPRVPFSEVPRTIGIVIPQGFESYVLIRHTDEGDIQGALGPETLKTLLAVLSKFTTVQEDCFYAMWKGYGWGHRGVPLTAVRGSRLQRFFQEFILRYGSHPRRKRFVPPREHSDLHTLPDGILNSELFKLPSREYLLAKGPLIEALKIGHVGMGWFQPQSPNLLWPSDRSWILVTEIDYDVTLIAGSEKLIEAILSTDSLTSERFLVTDTIEKLQVAGS